MSALPDPVIAPTLGHDTPLESPPSGVLVTALTVRLLYSDGYGGVTLPGPSSSLTIPGGAGRVTIGSAVIPASVRRVIVVADTITVLPVGSLTPLVTTDTVLYWLIEPSSPGIMPAIELWAHDMGDLTDGTWNTAPPSVTNSTSLPRPGAAVPDPVAAPVGATLAGVGPFPEQTFNHVQVAFAFQASSVVPPGRSFLTELGPLLDIVAGAPADTVHIPAQSGLPAGVVALWVWVFVYADGTNLSQMYRYHVPVSGGACAAFSFSTSDVTTQQGSWHPYVYPVEYDLCWPNPSALDVLRLTYNRGAGPNVRCYETDSGQSRLYADGAVVLQTPLAELTRSPDTLVGRDPDTNLPAYCPPPAVTTSVPITPVVVPIDPVPGGTDPCQQARCGAALALQAKVTRDYDQWRQWINAAVGFAIGGLIASVLAELAAILAAAEVAAWILQIFKIVSPIIGLSTTTLLPRLIPGLTAPQVDFVLKACYCPLACVGGQIVLSEAQKVAISAALLGNMTIWTSDLQRELIGEIAYYEPLQDWQAATLAAQPVNDCAGISCP